MPFAHWPNRRNEPPVGKYVKGSRELLRLCRIEFVGESMPAVPCRS
jgi:hypothetical protein